MDSKTVIRLGARRIFILFLISLGMVWVGSELAYKMIKDPSDRAPEVIELTIPDGTASRVEAGEPVPAIPEEMVFVVGDTLLIRNQDRIDHQLGPLWVPAGSNASLVMEEPERLAYSCSFQTSKYLDLDVKAATTLETRVAALALAVPPTTMFLFVYSLIIWPLTTRKKEKDGGGSANSENRTNNEPQHSS
jgi:hypothetical protein